MNNNSIKKDLRFKLTKLLSVIISVLFLFAVIAIIVPDKNLISTASGATLYVGGSSSGNYTYIQEAIDAAKPGDTVYVYNKTYYECIQINKSINLTGENILGRRPIIDGGENFHVVYVNNVKFYFNMRGFEVRNSSLKGAYSGIYINLSSNINIINNKIHDCVDGIIINSS